MISEFELAMLTHTFLRIEGVTEEGQMVPNLKEVLSWGAEVASATKSVYLELIPEKADNKDTVLYALNIIEELFIKKLKYEHIIVCGDSLTVNILYQINAMSIWRRDPTMRHCTTDLVNKLDDQGLHNFHHCGNPKKPFWDQRPGT